MRIEKLILGLLFLPLIILLLVIFLPLILFFGIYSLVLRRKIRTTFMNMQSFQWQSSQQKQDEDVIDVEVIRSENVGAQNDISGRSLR